MPIKLTKRRASHKDTTLDEITKEVLGDDLNDMIESIDIIEDIPPNQRKKQMAALMITSNRIFYHIRGSITIKKAMAFLAGSGGLAWLINHYIIPILIK